MQIVSIRERPDLADEAIAYFQRHWGSAQSNMVYEDCIRSCLRSKAPLPQWYLLYDADTIAGCVGLIPNDFISRMDLCPWLCALYVDDAYRGHAYGRLLIERCKADAKALGFSDLYLCTDLVGYYERYGFAYVGMGYHPWGESSRVYGVGLVG